MARYKSVADAELREVVVDGRVFKISSAYVNDVLLLVQQKERATQRGSTVRDRNARIFELRRQGMTQKDIAAELNMTRVNVSMILNRSRDDMVIELNEQGMTPEQIARELNMRLAQVDGALARANA